MLGPQAGPWTRHQGRTRDQWTDEAPRTKDEGLTCGSYNRASRSTVPLTPGTRLGPYEVIAQIGVGGMGEVYRARDAKLGRDVALKILPEAFVWRPGSRGPLRTRSAGRCSAEPPEHRHHPWLPGIGWRECARPRACRGRDTHRGHRARAAAAHRCPGDRQADRRRARSRARQGHRPSRLET